MNKKKEVVTIHIDADIFNRRRKKMSPEELAGYHNYTKKSAHVFRDRTKYTRKNKHKKKETE